MGSHGKLTFPCFPDFAGSDILMMKGRAVYGYGDLAAAR